VRVLYFGTYERDYPRNAHVIACLRAAGVDVVEHHVPVWDGREHKLDLGLAAASRLARARLRLLRRPTVDFDVLVVGYPGHLDLGAARRAAGKRPVVFNPLVSLEDTVVGDRGLTGPSSPKARLIRLVDRRAFRGADLVVADTDAHARWFVEHFDLEPDRVAVCLVGADDRLFTPGPPADERQLFALFVGKLIPLHGLETILAAAALCPEIEFRVVGSGQLQDALAARSANVAWEPWVEYERLPDLYRSAGYALGIFGTSNKAARVIPNKAFQALATATPLVTADTPAARELLEDGRDALLVPAGDADALAAAVRRLAADPDLRRRIARGGRATYERHASERVLGARWREVLERAVDQRARRASAR
jgi:glycosyltransferase involved in cell wall biosynthesis